MQFKVNLSNDPMKSLYIFKCLFTLFKRWRALSLISSSGCFKEIVSSNSSSLILLNACIRTHSLESLKVARARMFSSLIPKTAFFRTRQSRSKRAISAKTHSSLILYNHHIEVYIQILVAQPNVAFLQNKPNLN